MKRLYFASLIIMILGCSQTTGHLETESTNVVVDSSMVSTDYREESSGTSSYESNEYVEEEEEGPFLGDTENFPYISLTSLSDDTVEWDVNGKLVELIQAYDTLQYHRITSSYSWTRTYCAPAQEGPCDMATERAEEQKIWFFDQENQLRAYYRAYNINTYGSYEQAFHYFFSSTNGLIGVSEFSFDQNDAVSIADVIRLSAASCPQCGVRASAFGEHMDGQMSYSGLNGEVRYLQDEELTSRQSAFDESMAELITILKSVKGKTKKDGTDLMFSINQVEEGDEGKKSDEVTYTVEFTVDKDLYSYLVSQ